MSEKWNGWDLDNPPVEGAFITDRGWEIPLKGTDPDKNLTELVVAISDLNAKDVNPPVVTLVASPDDGLAKVTGDVVTIEVFYDEIVDVTGIPQLNLFANDGTTPLVNVTADFVSVVDNVLTFEYLVDVTDLEPTGIVVGANIVLNGGTIKDKTGVDVDLTTQAINIAVTLN